MKQRARKGKGKNSIFLLNQKMLRVPCTRRAPYLLFRYLESDWRNPIDRGHDATRAKDVLQQVATGSVPETSAADLTSESYGHRILFSFTKNAMTDDVSAALRYIRSKTNLEAFHFNALLRCVASSREKHAAMNLLQLMEQKGEADEETAAVVIAALHSWSGKNRMPSIIALLRQLYLTPVNNNSGASQQQRTTAVGDDGNDTNNHRDGHNNVLDAEHSKRVQESQQQQQHQQQPQLLHPLPASSPWTVRTAWELCLWPRPKRVSDEMPVALARQPRDLPEFAGTRIDDALLPPKGAWAPSRRNDLKRSTHNESQVLSSLLNAVVNGPEGALSALVVVAWMKAAGAELSSFDFFHVVTALARDVEQFREIRAVFVAPLPNPFVPSGSINLAHIRGSLLQLIANATAAAAYTGSSPPYWLRAASALAKLAVEVVEEQRPGLSTASVYVGFVNIRHGGRAGASGPDLNDVIRMVFDEVHRRHTVGAAGESPEHVHHGCALALLTMRRDSLAVQELGRFWNHLEKRRDREEAASAAAAAALSSSESSSDSTTLSLLNSPGDADAEEAAAAKSLTRKKRTRSLFQTPQTSPFAPSSVISFFDKTAPSLFPGNDVAVPRVHLWFVRDVAQRFSYVPRAVRDEVKPAFQELCKLGARTSEEVDQWMCWALGLPLLTGKEEVNTAVKTVMQTLSRRDAERSVRQMVRSLLQLFASRPPAKSSGAAAAATTAAMEKNRLAQKAKRDHFMSERKKWAGYFEARDAALAFFGHTRTARDMMKRVFAEGGVLPSVRSPDVVEMDINDVAALFRFRPNQISGMMTARISNATVLGNLPHLPAHFDLDSPEAKSMKIPILPLSTALQRKSGASGLPSLSSSSFNNGHLPRGLNGSQSTHSVARGNEKEVVEQNEEEQEEEQEEDLFMEFHTELQRQQDPWWFTEVEPSCNYLRCMLHRFDWQGASEVAKLIVAKQGYQAALDAEVHKIFEELGDPAGAMCFKFATKLIDGRILEENREKGNRRRRPQIFGATESRPKLGTHLAREANSSTSSPPPPLELRREDEHADAGYNA